MLCGWRWGLRCIAEYDEREEPKTLRRIAPPPPQSSLVQHGGNDPPRPLISSEVAKTLWQIYNLITGGVFAFWGLEYSGIKNTTDNLKGGETNNEFERKAGVAPEGL